MKLSIADLRELFVGRCDTQDEPHTPFEVGTKWFIRTCTYHMTGRITAVYGGRNGCLVLEEAAWIALSGRFADAIAKGTLDEVEPVGDQVVMLGAIVDAFPWKHDLPTEQK